MTTCDFCGQDSRDAKWMIATPKGNRTLAHICDSCVKEAASHIEELDANAKSEPQPITRGS